MKKLILDIVGMPVHELQSLDMRLEEDIPAPEQKWQEKIIHGIRATVEFIFYLSAMILAVGIFLIVMGYVFLHLFVWGWIWLDEHYPRPTTNEQESSYVHQINP